MTIMEIYIINRWVFHFAWLFNVNVHLVILFRWVIPFDNKMAHMMLIVPVDVAITLYAHFVTNISFTFKCLTKQPWGLCFPDEVCLFKIHTSLIANKYFMSSPQTFSHTNGRYGCYIQHAIDSLKCVVLEVYHLEYMYTKRWFSAWDIKKLKYWLSRT